MDRTSGAGALAYTVDGQGYVLHVREVTAAAVAMHPAARPARSPAALLSPLAWEPLQRFLAWGAREGMTAAELLDMYRAGAGCDGRTTTERRGTTWR